LKFLDSVSEKQQIAANGRIGSDFSGIGEVSKHAERETTGYMFSLRSGQGLRVGGQIERH